MSEAAERVSAYLAEIEKIDEQSSRLKMVGYSDEVHGLNDRVLRRSDLHELLSENARLRAGLNGLDERLSDALSRSKTCTGPDCLGCTAGRLQAEVRRLLDA